MKRERRREFSVGAAFTHDFLSAMDFPHVLCEQTSSGMTLRSRESMTLRSCEADVFAESLITKLTENMRLTENTNRTTEGETTTATSTAASLGVDQQRVSSDEHEHIMYINFRMKRMFEKLTSGDLAHSRGSHVLSRSSNPYRFSTTYIDNIMQKERTHSEH